MKIKFFIFFTFIFFISIFVFENRVFSFYATSTNFEIHGSALDSISGFSTSTNFQNIDAAGQNALGNFSSTTKKIYSGILNWLAGYFTPRYEQIHYRWRNDNDSETAASWAANEDAILNNLTQNTIKRLRLEISNEGWSRGSGQSLRLEYASTTTCSSGSYSAVPSTATTEPWEMADSSYLVDSTSTTNISSGLTDANAVFTAGQVKDSGNQTVAINITSENFTEVEYSIRATTNSVVNGHYCFRLTNAGSNTNFIYSQYPETTISVSSLSLSVSTSTVNLGILVPGVQISATTSASVIVSGASSGYYLSIKRDDSDTTLDLNTNAAINFPDYIAWDPSGNGNATTTPGDTFSFRAMQTGTDSNYNSTWWGGDDTTNAKYVGLPITSQQIMNCNTGGSCNSGTTVTVIKYRADAPGSQTIGSYDGLITITALANP